MASTRSNASHSQPTAQPLAHAHLGMKNAPFWPRKCTTGQARETIAIILQSYCKGRRCTSGRARGMAPLRRCQKGAANLRTQR